MKVTKFAHSCILVEEQGTAILMDPGSWNAEPTLSALDAILITHEHGDHCDTAQIASLLSKHPGARVITHAAVQKVLEEKGITAEPIEPGQMIDMKGVTIESSGTDHAVIYGSSPCRNTGFLIAERLFAPGDALHDIPSKPVEVLALPTGGPWMKIAEAIDYAKKLAPKVVFPIHDAMYIDMYQRAVGSNWIGAMLKGDGIEFRDLPAGASLEV